MPTPVSLARQCLTEEAARALDEAVAVARRRSHAQTTSLHAVSALLALPSSALRDACARAKSRVCSSRLQFRALDLSVGVSLDRLPSVKTLDEPPVSNSLMAAIKRSQANQRRHPDNFHLQQIHCNQQTASVLKVELKYFILSILDDPIVSRVFGEAGFRSCDIKIAIAHPPITQTARFSRAAPIFLCNITDSGPALGSSRPGFSFPFSTFNDVDENGRVIGNVLMRGKGKGSNPMLIGVNAKEGLKRFIECVNQGDKGGVLARELSGLSVISIEDEVKEFATEGSGDDEGKMGKKFEELRRDAERCSGPGVVVHFGDLGVLVEENVRNDGVSYVVSKLTGLLEGFKEKLWLMGSAVSGDVYSKFLGRFPNVEKDWDLSLQPISYSRKLDLASNSSLMGSFIPLGGFFSTDYKNPSSSISQLITRCHLCSAKYEQDLANILNVGSTSSATDQNSENLPSWLQMTEQETRKGVGVAKARDDGTTLDAKILGLQKKWNDICQRLHHAQPLSKFGIYQAGSQSSVAKGFQYNSDAKETNSSTSRDSLLNQSRCANLKPSFHMDCQKNFPEKDNVSMPVSLEAENINHQSNHVEQVSKNKQKERAIPWLTSHDRPNVSPWMEHTSSSSITSVTTDLGLGTLYSSNPHELSTSKFCDPEVVDTVSEHFSACNSTQFDAVSENTSRQIARASLCSSPPSGGQFDLREYKSVRRALAEKVGWQDGVISTISQAVSRCKAGYRRHHGSNSIWLTFLGPDRIGKKKIASALAEIIFGSSESLVSVDLSPRELNYEPRDTMVVDYIATALIKKPHLVILLENIDKADLLAQTSLLQAMSMGKFRDSYGRETRINDVIFVATSSIMMGDANFPTVKETIKFSEERILGSKSWQMRILIEPVAVSASTSSVHVKVNSKISVNKRKMDGTGDSMEQEISSEDKKRAQKVLRSCLDLNVPVEVAEESDSTSESSQAWLEEFLDQVDEKVVFEPFDFDALAEKMVKDISKRFHEVFGSEMILEIDDEVMVQLLSVSWLSERKRAVEDWIENVLGRGFTEARGKCQIPAQGVVKLVSCKGLLVEEQAPEVCLPSRINL